MGLIYLDTCLVIYLVEDVPRWSRLAANAVGRAGASRFAISPLVKLECLVRPIRDADLLMRRAYEAMFASLEAVSMPDAVYLQAADLRAKFGLKTPDALHLACAQYHRCEALWTNDDRLASASHGLARKILK